MAVQCIPSQAGTNRDLAHHGAEQTYRDALCLAKRMRAYLLTKAPAHKAALPLRVQALFSVETLRVSSRIMHVIAWGLTQKALAAGELSPKEAHTDQYRLPAIDHFSGGETAIMEDLPPAVQEMAAQSEALYMRAQRLDRMLQAQADGRVSVHELMSGLVKTVK